MKKLTITLTIVLGLAMTSFAQGSMFHRESSGSANSVYQESGVFSKAGEGDASLMPGLPIHGQSESQDAPLGGGIALLTALGAAYLVGKRRKEE